MPSKKIITATAVLILSLTTACSVFSDDNTVILLTSQENDGRITNEDFERLRKNITDAKNSEESPRTARELATAQRTKSEDQRWCQAWALDNLKPHIYAEFAKLNPDTMDDLDRTIWRTRLENNSTSVNRPFSTNPVTYDHDYRDFPHDGWTNLVGTCWMYWSEPLGMTNADQRNVQYEAECKRNLMNLADSEWDNLASAAVRHDDTAAYEIPNQYVRVLKWLDMSGQELLEMSEPPYELLRRLSDQEYAYNQNVPTSNETKALAVEYGGEFNKDWWHLVGATLAHRGTRSDPCQLYYPQLFYGYWVPFEEPYADEPDQLSADEVTEVERITAGPMYLPKP